MNLILNVFNNDTIYNNSGIFNVLKDKMKMNFENEYFLKDINASIRNIKVSSNINYRVYNSNIKKILNKYKSENFYTAYNIYRPIDFHSYSMYQKKLFAFGVAESIRCYLRISKKSISNSCITIYDAKDKINKYILDQISKDARYIVLLSDDLRYLIKQREYIVYNYGVTPIITKDYDYAFSHSDFIITSRNIDIKYNSPIWYIDDNFIPVNRNKILINDVKYKVPWDMRNIEVNNQILGSILNLIGNKSIDDDLKNNGIYLDEYVFKTKCNFSVDFKKLLTYNY